MFFYRTQGNSQWWMLTKVQCNITLLNLTVIMRYTVTANGPDPPHIFTLVKVSDNKIAIKSGFGRYVSCGTTGELVGRAEAIGPRELWETVFENVCKNMDVSKCIIYMRSNT